MEAYRPEGTCSRQIIFAVNDDGILIDLKFLGGCAGNLQALVRFCLGRHINEIIEICGGIKCRNDTSCPDQLAIALRKYQKSLEDPESKHDKHRGHPRTLAVH